MKLRITLIGYTEDHQQDAGHTDVTLTADVTATVGEIARSLSRAGAGNQKLASIALTHKAPLTLRVHYPDRKPLILDHDDTLQNSGLQSGATVEPVLDAAPGEGERVRTPVAQVTILSGTQKGVTFSAVYGDNTIGSDRSNRIEILDAGVARSHAVLRINEHGAELEDLGSEAGTKLVAVNGQRTSQVRVGRTKLSTKTVAVLGATPISIELIARPAPDPIRYGSVLNLQSPVVDPVYQPDPTELPAPPEDPAPPRFPLVAMAAPIMMGGVLYMATRSMLSIIFVCLSPLIMIGTWLDGKINRRRQMKKQRAEFVRNLEAATNDLTRNQETEREARNRESKPARELLSHPTSGALELWSRRPEHRSFLELRLGVGDLRSRKEVKLPSRGKIPAESWKQIEDLHARFTHVTAVPVIERLDLCGSLGVAGESRLSAPVIRSLLVQLFALQSPADLVFTAFANHEQANGEWSWLKWVPHVDSVFSPVSVPHLVVDERSASTLLAALEGLISQRGGGEPSPLSRLKDSAADASERAKPVTERPPHPSVVVLVLDDTHIDRSRLVGLAEDGADVGVHVIWGAAHISAIPAACRTVVDVGAEQPIVHFVRQGEQVVVAADTVDHRQADSFGRALAPVVDAGARVLDETDFPRSVSLSQVLPGDILDTGEVVARRWLATDSIVSRWTEGEEREPGRLAAVIGLGSEGPVEVDLRAHGPHALVGGTTGSGKSEFLQTWIMSLAASYSPDRLTFLLVDYKGGAAFADCERLPHTVGLVTDLNQHLVRRALTSLRAELRYREELLAEKSAKDLVALERRGDPEAPPNLMIVVDEFAALVGEVPEFVDGVVDVAQRGRSLGIHLVLATQRPAGVIKDNLRANTNLRVGLRMADEADSADVIGAKDAAHFSPDVPGRAVFKIGAGRLTHFQTAYLGGRSEEQAHQEVVEIHDLSYGEQAAWTLRQEEREARVSGVKPKRDIERLAANIQQAANAARIEAPRKPWVDQLPSLLPLSSLPEASTAKRGWNVPLGMIDEPQAQTQSPFAVNLQEVGGIVLFGGAGTGKSTSLASSALAFAEADVRTQIYGIDAGGGRLRELLSYLPNTGDVIPNGDRDRVIRLLDMVKRTIDERADVRTKDVAPLLLIVDGLAAFRDTYGNAVSGVEPFADLVEIASSGRAAGVHVLIGAERSNALAANLAASFSERLSLRLPSEMDYNTLDVPRGVLEEAGPGRAIRIGSEEELQFALPGESAEPDDVDRSFAEAGTRLSERGARTPRPVPEVPEDVRRSEIEHRAGSPAFAIDTVHLQPVSVPSSGFMLVTGPAGSGRTTAIRSLIETFTEQRAGRVEQLDTVLISPHRSELRDHPFFSAVLDTQDERDDLLPALTLGLGGRSTVKMTTAVIGAPQLESEPEPDHRPFPSPGRRGIVVIEDIGGFDGSGNERELASLMKLLRRRDDIITVIEGENATLSVNWDLSAPLKGARWALALRPDANDVPSILNSSFAHARRREFPPGRGLLLESGSVIGVQVARAARDE